MSYVIIGASQVPSGKYFKPTGPTVTEKLRPNTANTWMTVVEETNPVLISNLFVSKFSSHVYRYAVRITVDGQQWDVIEAGGVGKKETEIIDQGITTAVDDLPLSGPLYFPDGVKIEMLSDWVEHPSTYAHAEITYIQGELDTVNPEADAGLVIETVGDVVVSNKSFKQTAPIKDDSFSNTVVDTWETVLDEEGSISVSSLVIEARNSSTMECRITVDGEVWDPASTVSHTSTWASLDIIGSRDVGLPSVFPNGIKVEVKTSNSTTQARCIFTYIKGKMQAVGLDPVLTQKPDPVVFPLDVPEVILPNLYNEPVTKGTRGWVGKDIFTKEDVFIPRHNRGGLHQVGRNLKWLQPSTNNTSAKDSANAALVSTSDGNLISLAWVDFNAVTASVNSPLEARIFDKDLNFRQAGDAIAFTGNVYNYNVNCSSKTQIAVKEVKPDFFIGIINTLYNNKSYYTQVVSFNYDSATKTIKNGKVIQANSVSCSSTYFERIMTPFTVNTQTDKLYIQVPYTISSIYVRFKTVSFDILGTTGELYVGNKVNPSQLTYRSVQHVDELRSPAQGLYVLSDGNLIDFNAVTGASTSLNPEQAGKGQITVFNVTDWSTIANHTLQPDNNQQSGTIFSGHLVMSVEQISVNEFIVLTCEPYSAVSGYHILRVSYTAGTNMVSVVHVDTVPNGAIIGCHWTQADPTRNNVNKVNQYDVTARRFILIGSGHVNIINLNPDYTYSPDTSGTYPTEVLDPMTPWRSKSNTRCRADLSTHVLMPGTNMLFSMLSLHDHNVSESNENSGKLNLLYSVDIKQCGSWGYPVTVNKDAVAGEDVVGLGNPVGYLKIANGISRQPLEGNTTVVTETVAINSKVPASSFDDSLRNIKTIQNTTESLSLWTFDGYNSDTVDYTLNCRQYQGQIDLDDALGALYESSEAVETLGLSFYSINHSTGMNHTAIVLIDGYFAYTTGYLALIRSSSSGRYYRYGISIYEAGDIKVFASSEGVVLNLDIHKRSS